MTYQLFITNLKTKSYLSCSIKLNQIYKRSMGNQPGIKVISNIKKLSGLYQFSPLHVKVMRENTPEGILLKKNITLYMIKSIYDLYCGKNAIINPYDMFHRVKKVTQAHITPISELTFPKKHSHGFKANLSISQHMLVLFFGQYKIDPQFLIENTNNKVNYTSFPYGNVLNILEQEIFKQVHNRLLLDSNIELIAINPDNITNSLKFSSHKCYKITKQPFSDFTGVIGFTKEKEEKDIFFDVKLAGEPERHLSCTRGYISLSPKLDNEYFMKRFRGDLGQSLTPNVILLSEKEKTIIKEWYNNLSLVLKSKDALNIKYRHFENINYNHIFNPNLTSILPTTIGQAETSTDFNIFFQLNQDYLLKIIDLIYKDIDIDVLFPINQEIDVVAIENFFFKFIKFFPKELQEEAIDSFKKIKLILPV